MHVYCMYVPGGWQSNTQKYNTLPFKLIFPVGEVSAHKINNQFANRKGNNHFNDKHCPSEDIVHSSEEDDYEQKCLKKELQAGYHSNWSQTDVLAPAPGSGRTLELIPPCDSF